MAYTTVNKPDSVFKVKLYTGNGSSNAITGVGFQPDFVWLKNRGSTGDNLVQDVVRGPNKDIRTNLNSAESDNGTTHLNSFDSDGFTLGGTGGHSNANSNTYVSFNFKAGGAASSNSNGSITSSVSVNTQKTFSIVTWTGTGANATIGHGLTTKPVMIWVKRLDASSNWKVYHREIGPDWTLVFNTNAARTQETNTWQSYHPTVSAFYVGSGTEENASGSPMVAYCFGEVDGCAKGGSWRPTGTGANGGFIHTGFAPEVVLYKRYTDAGNWAIHDRTRRPKNVNGFTIQFDEDVAEFSYENNSGYMDLLSNGFNLYGSSNGHNNGSSYYIYYAIGRPLVGTNNIPSNAR